MLKFIASLAEIIANITDWFRSNRDRLLGAAETTIRHMEEGKRVDDQISDIAENKPTPEEVRKRLRDGTI